MPPEGAGSPGEGGLEALCFTQYSWQEIAKIATPEVFCPADGLMVDIFGAYDIVVRWLLHSQLRAPPPPPSSLVIIDTHFVATKEKGFVPL